MPQDRVVRLESASIDAKHLERQRAALRKNLKTKLKRGLKSLVNDSLSPLTPVFRRVRLD